MFLFITFQIINIALSGEPTQKQKTSDDSISEPILKAAWKPINDVTLKLLSNNVDLLIKDPEAYLKKNFKSTTQFKDFNSLKNSITKNAGEIKKVKTSLEKDGLHLTYLNYALIITAHGIESNPYMINNHPFSWDPQKNTFDALKENIKKLIVVIPQTTFKFSIISKAQAANDSFLTKAVDILSSVIAANQVMFILHCNYFKAEKHAEDIQKAETILRAATERCQSDFDELKPQIKGDSLARSLDTLGLIAFLKAYNKASPVSSEYISCKSSTDNSLNRLNSICLKELNVFCKNLGLFNDCLVKTKELADSYINDGHTIDNYSINEERYSFKPSNEEYNPLMETLTGEPIQTK